MAMGSGVGDIMEIPGTQNADHCIVLRKATRAAYDLAMTVAVVQAALSVIVPAIAAALLWLCPPARPYTAAVALAVVVADIVVLDRAQKRLLRQGATLAEKFDCDVLDMPWNSFVVGNPPAPEDIRRLSKDQPPSGLQDWYARCPGLPRRLARILCQRANLQYDSRLRHRYASVLIGCAASIVVAALIYGLANKIGLTDFILTLTPVAPLLSWSGREFFRQKDAGRALEDLVKKADAFWRDAAAESSPEDECRARSRQFQDAIFARRCSVSPVFPFVYRLKRPQLEDEMQAANRMLCEEYFRSLH